MFNEHAILQNTTEISSAIEDDLFLDKETIDAYDNNEVQGNDVNNAIESNNEVQGDTAASPRNSVTFCYTR